MTENDKNQLKNRSHDFVDNLVDAENKKIENDDRIEREILNDEVKQIMVKKLELGNEDKAELKNFSRDYVNDLVSSFDKNNQE